MAQKRHQHKIPSPIFGNIRNVSGDIVIIIDSLNQLSKNRQVSIDSRLHLFRIKNSGAINLESIDEGSIEMFGYFEGVK